MEGAMQEPRLLHSSPSVVSDSQFHTYRRFEIRNSGFLATAVVWLPITTHTA
jgi:hypothetical protein